MSTVYYLFLPNGFVYHELPKGGAVDNFNLALAQSQDPAHVGRYRIIGNQIQFAWLGAGRTQSLKYRQLADGPEIDGDQFYRVSRFDDLRLDGVYTRSHDVQYSQFDRAQGGVSSERSIAFRADGRLSMGSVVAATGPGPGVGRREMAGGQYHITGNTLDVSYANGQRGRFTFFVHPESVHEARPRLIVIDGMDFLLEEGSASQAAPDNQSAAAGGAVDAESRSRWARRGGAASTSPNDAQAARRAAMDGIRFANARRWSESEARLRDAVRLDSTVAEYHAYLGYILFVEEQYQESLNESQAALRLQPNMTMAHDNAGDALLHLGQLQASEAEFREAIRLDPRTAEFQFDLARALSAEGRSDEALAAAREAVRLDPRTPKYQALVQKLGQSR
jgi:Flp pilus assembly protein TadD